MSYDPTVTVPDGYDRRRNRRTVTVRPVTRSELLSGDFTGDFVSATGEYRRCKINGRVRTWKTDPNRIEVPAKYGLYEYDTFRWSAIADRALSSGGAFLCKVIATHEPRT
uniref:Uncharacterized protein n=1 Tax=viral metagenome TaxID=1070528 RepID=A0A6M3LC62_9ZZZZ